MNFSTSAGARGSKAAFSNAAASFTRPSVCASVMHFKMFQNKNQVLIRSILSLQSHLKNTSKTIIYHHFTNLIQPHPTSTFSPNPSFVPCPRGVEFRIFGASRWSTTPEFPRRQLRQIFQHRPWTRPRRVSERCVTWARLVFGTGGMRDTEKGHGRISS